MHVETQSILLSPLCPQEKRPASISSGPTLLRGLASPFHLRLKEKEVVEVVRMQSRPCLAAQILGSVQRPELEGRGIVMGL